MLSTEVGRRVRLNRTLPHPSRAAPAVVARSRPPVRTTSHNLRGKGRRTADYEEPGVLAIHVVALKRALSYPPGLLPPAPSQLKVSATVPEQPESTTPQQPRVATKKPRQIATKKPRTIPAKRPQTDVDTELSQPRKYTTRSTRLRSAAQDLPASVFHKNSDLEGESSTPEKHVTRSTPRPAAQNPFVASVAHTNLDAEPSTPRRYTTRSTQLAQDLYAASVNHDSASVNPPTTPVNQVKPVRQQPSRRVKISPGLPCQADAVPSSITIHVSPQPIPVQQERDVVADTRKSVAAVSTPTVTPTKSRQPSTAKRVRFASWNVEYSAEPTDDLAEDLEQSLSLSSTPMETDQTGDVQMTSHDELYADPAAARRRPLRSERTFKRPTVLRSLAPKPALKRTVDQQANAGYLTGRTSFNQNGGSSSAHNDLIPQINVVPPQDDYTHPSFNTFHLDPNTLSTQNNVDPAQTTNGLISNPVQTRGNNPIQQMSQNQLGKLPVQQTNPGQQHTGYQNAGASASNPTMVPEEQQDIYLPDVDYDFAKFWNELQEDAATDNSMIQNHGPAAQQQHNGGNQMPSYHGNNQPAVVHINQAPTHEWAGGYQEGYKIALHVLQSSSGNVPPMPPDIQARASKTPWTPHVSVQHELATPNGVHTSDVEENTERVQDNINHFHAQERLDRVTLGYNPAYKSEVAREWGVTELPTNYNSSDDNMFTANSPTNNQESEFRYAEMHMPDDDQAKSSAANKGPAPTAEALNSCILEEDGSCRAPDPVPQFNEDGMEFLDYFLNLEPVREEESDEEIEGGF